MKVLGSMKQLLIFLIVFGSQIAFSQETKFVKDFRDVSFEELKMDSCSFYQGAEAMILFNISNLYPSNQAIYGMVNVLEIHKRIKIFTKHGKNLGSERIHYFNMKNNRWSDEIRDFEAYTYNLVDGEIIEIPLEKEDVFKNELNDYFAEKSFAMPDVQEGSIIDIKYKFVSHSTRSIPSWYFQDMIPVQYSEFTYEVPQYFVFQANTLGNVKHLKKKVSKTNLKLKSKVVNAEKTKLSSFEISPMEWEPFTTNFWGLLGRVEFDLVSRDHYKYGDYDYGSTYVKFNRKLMESSSFGSRLSKGRFSKKWKAELKGKTKLEKAKIILKKIQNNVSWNRSHYLYSDISGKKVMKDKQGDIADINLTLVSALKYHGIEVYPVVLMTKGRGIPHPIYPHSRKYNYVIALVKIEGVEYLCDASLDAPFGQIRKYCINDKGWMVDHRGRWIDLTKNAFYKEAIKYNIEIKDNFVYNKISVQLKDYAAFEAFSEYKNDVFQKQIIKSFDEWIIDEVHYDENNNGKVFKYNVVLKREIENDRLILIDPFTIDILKQNPFIREERFSNIDFIYKKDHNYIFNLDIPSGYTIEMPGNMHIETEDGDNIYFYMANRSGDKMNIVNRFNSKRCVYSPAEYQSLKVFYENMASSNKQIIVLKKIK